VETNEVTKKTRQKIYITGDNGQQVQAEKVWGAAIFPSATVSELRRWARETENDLGDLCASILNNGLATYIQQAEETKAERDAARRALKSTNVSTISSPEQLEQLERNLEAKLAAIRQRAAAIRQSSGEVALDEVLDTESDPDVPTEETAPVPRRGRNA
jgi:hypothetical protein